MPTMHVGPYTLRPLGGERLTRGFIRPVDIETYVIESGDRPDTHGQLQLALFHGPECRWLVWHMPAWCTNEQRQAFAAARNEPRTYTIVRTREGSR